MALSTRINSKEMDGWVETYDRNVDFPQPASPRRSRVTVVSSSGTAIASCIASSEQRYQKPSFPMAAKKGLDESVNL